MAAEDAPEIPSALLLAFAPLHRAAMGVASGVVLGGLVFIVTVVDVIRGEAPVLNLWLLEQFFFGYRVTVPGALIGLLWGFGVGFVLGWSFALLRNAIVWIWLAVIRSRAEMEQYGDFLDHL
jgi:hypothetical protein